MERLYPPPSPHFSLINFIKAIFSKIPLVGWVFDMFTGEFDPHPDTGSAPGASAEVRDLFGLGGTLAGMRWSQMDGNTEHLANLETRAQKLEGVIGYGSSYMTTNSLTPGSGWSKLPFTQRKGPIVGCELQSGTGHYILHSKGLWEVSYKAVFDALLGPVNMNVWLSVAVYTPGGVLFDRQSVKDNTGAQLTLGETCRIVVPASNYQVQIEAQCGTNYRNVLASPEYSSFNIVKISSETS